MLSRRVLGLCCAAALLSGCLTHTHALVREETDVLLAGELAHDRGEENYLRLYTDKLQYTARGFSVTKVTDWDAVSKRFRESDRDRYDRIVAGSETSQSTFVVETVAVGDDRSQLQCRLSWTGTTKPSGVCRDQQSRIIPIRFL